MKNILYLVLIAFVALCFGSCVVDTTIEDALESVGMVKINTRGNMSVVTANGQEYFVAVDSVVLAAGSQEINVDDSVNVVPENVKFKCFLPHVDVLSEKIVRREQFYVVKQLDCLLTLSFEGVYLPVRFTRQIVVSIDKGKEQTPYYTFIFNVVSESYLGTDKMKTFEESHSRSYYDLELNVSDNDEVIGTLKTKVSFFTANTPITFDVSVDDWEDVNVNTNF